MINRDARNRLADLIRRYLDEQAKAFDFDEALDEFRDSDDDAVRFVSETVWYHYDDCKDHLVVLNKPEWNYFQRLLLLLESTSEVTLTRSRHWTYTQLFAAFLLLACITIAFQTGIGEHLLIFFIPFGIGSIAISRFRHPAEEASPYDAIITPYQSFCDLRIAHEETRFQKVRYPSHLTKRTIRSPLMDWFGLAYCCIGWGMLPLIPLLFQCFPTSSENVKIIPA